jgi:hypothetical protein
MNRPDHKVLINKNGFHWAREIKSEDTNWSNNLMFNSLNLFNCPEKAQPTITEMMITNDSIQLVPL